MGKSGQPHQARIHHAGGNALISELQELPGQHLFRYEDEAGAWHDIGTSDVNEWLKETGGGDFSAKQFRTWQATVRCARELAKEPPGETKTGRKRAEMTAIRTTAEKFRHTPATCRKYYVHPEVLRAYRSGRLHKIMHRRPPKFSALDPAAKLRADERRVLWLLEHPEKKSKRGDVHDQRL